MDVLLQTLMKTGVTVAVKELLARVLNQWGNSNLLGRKLIRKLDSQEVYLNYIIKHVSRVIRLRTIHSSDCDVFLHHIYHDLKIQSVASSSSSVCIGDDFVINNQHINNIIGTAGQGKSTILRKLFLETLKVGVKIPFFLELRKIEQTGILKGLQDVLNSLRLKAELNDVEQLLISNNVVLMLDGFDEISFKYRDAILKEITNLNIMYGVQIITTTRPGTALCNEPYILNYRVLDLELNDILNIIEKLNDNGHGIDLEQLPKIKETITQNSNLISVMRTPILVTLFHVCYPFMDIIPNNTVEFYSSLFMTLYLRHDKVKNFEREKLSPLGHVEAYECFCALTFITMHNNNQDLNHNAFLDYAQRALKIKGKLHACRPEDLISDFLNITCMIQKDGYDRYVFIHKSIQEYHAAEFIKSVSSANKNKLYKILLDDVINETYRYANVISFLIEIDAIDAAKYLILPLCNHYNIASWHGLETEAIKYIFNEQQAQAAIIINFKQGNPVLTSSRYYNTSQKFNWLSLFVKTELIHPFDLFHCIYDKFVEMIFMEVLPVSLIMERLKSGEAYSIATVAYLLEIEDELISVFQEKLEKVYLDVYKFNYDKVSNETYSINEIFDV